MTDLRSAAVLSAAAAFLFGSGVMTGRAMAPANVVIAPVAVPQPAAAPAPLPPPPLPPPPLGVDLPPEGDPDPTPPAIVWGASVREVSTQYGTGTDDWSASRALGAPDVWPETGDQVNAWASESADDRPEFLEVGLARPTRLSAAEVVETYNPGAVSAIDLIGASGAHHVVYRGKAKLLAEGGFRRHVDFACTSEPIVAIRVTIDSTAVAGWNEIDAIGGQPCREQ